MPDFDPDVRAILFDGYVRELGSLMRRMREIAAPGTPEAAITDLTEGLSVACANYLRARQAKRTGRES